MLVYRADLQLKRFQVELGDNFRHREYAGGGSGVSSAAFPATVASNEHHYGYLGVTYATPSIRRLANSVFSVNVTG